MKKKFESNVAAEIPKTKLHEPQLPWKVTADDVARGMPADEEYKSVIAGTPPLKTRAIFLIVLVATMFLIASMMIVNAVTDNERIRQDMIKRERELVSIKTDLQKLNSEKDTLTKSSAQLEKKVSDLSAQKELFASVIESLTKKSDDVEVEKKETN